MSSPESTHFSPTPDRLDDWHETVLGLVGDGAYQLDTEGRFVAVNDVVLDTTGYDADQLLGEHVSLIIDESSVERTERVLRELLDGNEPRAVTETAAVRPADGETFRCEFRMMPLVEDGEFDGTVGIARDLTDRRLRERRLRDERDELRARFEEVRSRVTDAVYALDEDWQFTYLNGRAEELMDVEAAAVLGESIWSVFPEAEASELWDRYHEAMARQERVSFETFYEPAEVWFEASVYPSETGLSVYFRDVTERKTRERELAAQRERLATLNDLNRVVQDVTHAIVEADTREDVERAVPEQLAAAASVAGAWFGTVEPGGGAVRVTSEAGAVGTRPGETIPVTGDGTDDERAGAPVARAFRTGDPCTIDDLPDGRAEASDGGDAVDGGSDVALTTGPPDAQTTEPPDALTTGPPDAQTTEPPDALTTGPPDAQTTEPPDALTTGPPDAQTTGPTDPQTTDAADSQTTGPAEPRQSRTREYGSRSAAAIPVSFQGIRYGVLVVYGTDPGTFEGDAGTVVCRLGEVVGHALNALDRKRALEGDEVTELEFRVENVLETRGVDPTNENGRIVFESVLPVGDGRYVAYGSACEDGVELLETMLEALPHYRELDVRERRSDDDQFVLRMRDSPLTTLTTSLGGRLDGARIEDDDLHATVSLRYDVDVRAFVGRVSQAYPGAEVLAQRRIRRPGAHVDAFQTVLDEGLTERQRVALEAAYVAGFFEWPRETTGEELAASLDVSPATFHQHLREAERRVITGLFDAPGE